MTLIAGIYCFSGNAPLPEKCVNALRKNLSRHPSDVPIEYQDDRCYLVKVDIGAYQESGVFVGEHDVSYMSGDPLLVSPDRNNAFSRTDSLDKLRGSWLNGDTDTLRQAYGQFSVVHYNSRDHILSLATDKLGIRPIYYWIGDDFVVFSSALRVLEAVDLVPKRMSLRGVSELATFGCCLADRTPFADISCLDAGQTAIFHDGDQSTEYYWQWKDLLHGTRNYGEADLEDLTTNLYDAFVRAIKRRLKSNESSVSCFLSGGLDSRAIATVLADNCEHLHTLNISEKNCLDEVLAAKFASAIDSEHHQSHNRVSFVHPSAHLKDIYANHDYDRFESDRPQLVWSGDGGSVGLGWVYLNTQIQNFLDDGQIDQATKEFLTTNKMNLPMRFFGANAQEILRDFPAKSIREEIRRLDPCDETKSIFFFLLLNDQRRHLFKRFETVDVDRIELHLPFFDSEFLEGLLQVPGHEGLYHNFYHRWLKAFSPVIKSIAWQTYPGHLKCPVPVPDGISNQWSSKYDKKSKKSGGLEGSWLHLLRLDLFPHTLFRRSHFALAMIMHKLRIKDYSYLLKKVGLYSDYWRKSHREIKWIDRA